MKLENDIIYIATTERADNYKYFPEHENIPGNVQIISIRDFLLIQDQYTIEISGQPMVGTILARNPFDKQHYLEFDKFVNENFIFRKWLKLCEIANHLGAKYVEATFLRSETHTIEWDINMKTGICHNTDVEGTLTKCTAKSEQENGKIVHRGEPGNKLSKKSYKKAYIHKKEKDKR